MEIKNGRKIKKGENMIGTKLRNVLNHMQKLWTIEQLDVVEFWNLPEDKSQVYLTEDNYKTWKIFVFNYLYDKINFILSTLLYY